MDFQVLAGHGQHVVVAQMDGAGVLDALQGVGPAQLGDAVVRRGGCVLGLAAMLLLPELSDALGAALRPAIVSLAPVRTVWLGPQSLSWRSLPPVDFWRCRRPRFELFCYVCGLSAARSCAGAHWSWSGPPRSLTAPGAGPWSSTTSRTPPGCPRNDAGAGAVPPAP